MNTRVFSSLVILGGFLLVFLGHQYARNWRKELDIGRGPLLRFRPNHEFVILQITDLHYGENEYKDSHSDQIQEKLIKLVQPDMVVNTGDAISGNKWNKVDKGWYRKLWERFTKPYLTLKIPYAYALGNHDREADATLDEIAEMERSHPYSLFRGTRDIDPSSLSNYLTHIYSSFEGVYDKISALLWIFDSKKSCRDVVDGNGCIDQAQLNWYEKMSQSHAEDYGTGDKIQGMAFFHVPIQEFMFLWNKEKTFGVKGEHVCCPFYNTGVFERFLKVGNVRVIGCGHDHNSNFGGNLNGIDLVYGVKTGYGSYGPVRFQRGARVFKLKEKMEASGEITWTYETYNIYEDGSIQRPEEPRWQGNHFHQDHCES
jgi:hypothetical protein